MNTLIGASVEFARALFTRGTDIFGAREIKEVFGLDVSEPEIPFSEEELRRARELGQILVLFAPGVTMRMIHDVRSNKTSDGHPLFYNTDWYKNEPFYTNDPVRSGWRLVSREVVPNSRSKNYLEQTKILCDYLVEVLGLDLPDPIREAVAEFRSQTQELTGIMDRDWRETAKRLVELKLNQMFRETPAEVLYVLALYEGVNHERLLPSGSWSWTNLLSSRGGVGGVGGFDDDGVYVSYDDPGGRSSDLGFRFSRSGTLES